MAKLLLSTGILFLICADTALSQSKPVFPGKGDRKQWEEAWKLGSQGIAKRETSHTAAAIRLHEQAIALYPYDPKLFVELGHDHRKKYQMPEAMQAYQGALKLDPKCVDATCGIAAIYAANIQYDKAEQVFKDAVKLNPTSIKLLCDLADTYESQHKYAEAYATYLQAAKTPDAFKYKAELSEWTARAERMMKAQAKKKQP